MCGSFGETLLEVLDALQGGERVRKRGEGVDRGERTDNVKLNNACWREVDELKPLGLCQLELLELVEQLAHRLVRLPSEGVYRLFEVTESLAKRVKKGLTLLVSSGEGGRRTSKVTVCKS